jgi:signal transduction histidine kinase
LVLRNLISNAIKHHDRVDGHVHIAVRTVGAFIEFTVADDGPGIAPQHHSRIFQMFQTLKPRDQQEGSGIGLAVVQRTVESRGGKISVESAEGQGARFCFTWPQ